MSVKYIKNEIVKMLWDAEGFFESKSDGFIAAVHIYNGKKGDIAVMFKDGKAFVLIDPDTDMPTTREDLFAVTAECHKVGVNIEDEYEDSYAELCNGADYNLKCLEYYGLSSEDGEDILNRLNDLSVYWETETYDGF